MICNKELLELAISIGEDTSIRNLQKHQNQINSIVEHLKTTELYTNLNKNSKKLREGYADEMDAEECYMDMVHKIVIAPMGMLADGAVILILPIIADKLIETTVIGVE